MATNFDNDSRDGASREVKRAESRFQKLREGNHWVMTNAACGKVVRERFAPKYGTPPPYLPIGGEVGVMKDLVQEGIPVVLAGPPGVGKTSLVRAVFHELGIPLQTYVCSASTTEAELFGRLGVGGDQGELTVWKDGKLSLAARAAAGGVVSGFYLDEVIKLPAAVASSLYSLLDHRQSLSLPTGEELEMGGNLKLVFSYNPTREARLEDAFRSRLTALRLSFAPPKVESAILCDRRIGCLVTIPNGDRIAASLVAYANQIRHAFGYRIAASVPALDDRDRALLRRLPAPPSTRALVVTARMVSRSHYSPFDSARTFLIPSLLQDTHDYDLVEVEDALLYLAEKHLSKVGPLELGPTDTPGEDAVDPLVDRQVLGSRILSDLIDRH